MPIASRRWLLKAGAALVLPCEALAAPQVRVQILVAKSSKVSGISMGELRQIYRSRVLSLGGQTAIPFNHPPGAPDRVGFDRVVLEMSAAEVGRYWIDQKIRGGGSPPRTVESVGLLLRVLARLPGAIGYVREGFSSPELKVLSVDGRLPGDRDYGLVY